jgi:hypothetical protein
MCKCGNSTMIDTENGECECPRCGKRYLLVKVDGVERLEEKEDLK